MTRKFVISLPTVHDFLVGDRRLREGVVYESHRLSVDCDKILGPCDVTCFHFSSGTEVLQIKCVSTPSFTVLHLWGLRRKLVITRPHQFMGPKKRGTHPVETLYKDCQGVTHGHLYSGSTNVTIGRGISWDGRKGSERVKG